MTNPRKLSMTLLVIARSSSKALFRTAKGWKQSFKYQDKQRPNAAIGEEYRPHFFRGQKGIPERDN